MLLKKLVIGILFLISVSANASLIYELESGSTITNQSTGIEESLTGSFEWEFIDNYGDAIVMRMINLHFQSDSITIDFLSNEIITNLFFVNDPNRCLYSNCESFFNTAVTTTGLDIDSDTPLAFSSNDGEYKGNIFSPNRLIYNHIDILGLNGGSFLAHANLSATLVNQVPEPGTLALMAIAMFFLPRSMKNS